MVVSEPNQSKNLVEQTTIFTTDENLDQYPFCVIPHHFFDRMLARLEKQANPKLRTVLSIKSYDGRQVMRVTGY